MFIRVTRGRFDPARFDEFHQLVDDVATAVRRLPGLQSLMDGVDRARGQMIAVSTWDTEEHARWSAAALGGDFPSRLQALGVQLDPPEFFEATTT
jgi:hypothetical protein